MQLLHNVLGITMEDYLAFGKFLMTLQSADYKQLLTFLNDLKLKRYTRWHVYQAPDDIITPDQSMFLFGSIPTLPGVPVLPQRTSRRLSGCPSR